MASLEEIRENRIKKLKKLVSLGISPYPAEVKREENIGEVIKVFDEILKSEKRLSLVGRVMSIRGQGAIIFFDLFDGTGRIQALLKKGENVNEESFNLFNEVVDIGDFLEVQGSFFLTNREEKTILLNEWRMVSKSLRPLPEKWHGLQDTEERLRRRYLDILFNPEVRNMFEKKAMFWQSTRNFLVDRGFLEVETPVLETTTGGADARPFETHHNALDMDVYLRISAGELWQKRLMVAGFPKVFEIGRIFRNEGMSAEHLQDYTQMEFYWAYADYKEGMKLTEELYKYVAEKTFGTLQFEIGEYNVDLSKEWKIFDYTGVIKEKTGIDVLDEDLEKIEDKLKELGVRFSKEGWNRTRAVDNLWKYVRKSIGGPGFLVNVPVFLEPLAKRHRDNDQLVERFQIIIAGSEVGKGYSELNDPIDQKIRFDEQQKMRDKGDEEAQMADYDFVEALEYGMPPTCGFGMSERVFAFLANKPVREAQAFPLMKPRDK